MTTRELQTKLERARWWLIGHQPFYGALAMRLPDTLSGCPVPTACTDGRGIKWHPPFLDRLTDEETRAVLIHEVLHNAHGHFWRLDPKDPLAQEAADHANNILISGIEGATLPQPCFCDPRFAGKAEEEILGTLRRERSKAPDPNGNETMPGGEKGQGQGQGEPQDGIQDPGNCGGFEPPPAPNGKPAQTPAEQAAANEQAKEDWTRAVIAAAQSAKLQGRGDIPATFARLVDAATAPPSVDWRQETADFLRTAIGSRNDWSRSARRHAWQPVVYPRKRRDACGTVVIARDTSGSIDDDVFKQFSAAVSAAQAELQCEIILLDCDAEIAAEHRLAPGDEIPPATGGGGTDFRPVFARVRQLTDEGETIAGVVYLTDLDGDEPKPADVDTPTLWVCTTDRVAKTGRTVKIQ